MELSERKKQILKAIIGDYIRTAEPVGSKALTEGHELPFSSATIRNEMSELEDMGYATTGDLEPIENFYLDPTGITFYYNVYDITPYSMGPVKVTIPFSMMEHLLGSNPILGELKN